jgi:glycosyltransferase 2 family protein
MEMVEPTNKASGESCRKGPRLWGWHTGLSLVVALAILVCLAMKVDLKDLWRQVAGANKGFILLGALAHYATYPVRGCRWRHGLLPLSPQAGRAKFGLLVFFYNFVDNVVPAKLGDVYGAHLARINCGVSRAVALGSIVFLRMIDSWIVLLLALLASLALFSAELPRPIVWSLLGGAVIALTANTILVSFFLLRKSPPVWLPQRVQQIIHGFHTGMWPRAAEILPILGLTAAIWTLETLWIFFLVLAFGVRLRPVEAVFLTMIPLLASAFPFTPSGAGVVEVTLFSCLRVVGVPTPVAVSLTAINRALDYWLHIGLGLVLWAIRRGIGLRTWREVPLEEVAVVTAPEPRHDQEVIHAG